MLNHNYSEEITEKLSNLIDEYLKNHNIYELIHIVEGCIATKEQD